MPKFLCDFCKKETQFLPICSAIRQAGVSRSTIYYWMSHGWVHWRELPSTRRVICQESLSYPGTKVMAEAGRCSVQQSLRANMLSKPSTVSR
jgi:predicted DNA-binding transcriptional regulator AlpA